MLSVKRLATAALGVVFAAATIVVVRAQSVDGMLKISSAKTDMIAARPIGVLSPKDESECKALADAWAVYRQKRTQAHTVCIDAFTQSKTPTVPDPATGCDVLQCGEFHGSGPGQDDVNACYAEVRQYKDREREETARKKKEEDDAEARRNAAKKSDPPSTKQDASKRDPDRKTDVDTTDRDKTEASKPSSSSSSDKLGDFRDDLRQMRDEAIKAQMKADERALDRAEKASQLEQELLAQRTAERDAEKVRIEAGIGVIDARYAAEAGQLTDKQSGLVARLFDSAVNNTVASATAGGSGAADFDFDARIESLETRSNALSIVGSVIAPFASLPLSITNWILEENLKTFNDLSKTLVNFDRTAPADVERVWRDYHARVWAPEQWISKIAIETASDMVAGQLNERLVQPAFERAGRAISNRSLREIFRPMPEQEAITWRWFSGSSTRVEGSLRTDTSGMPLLRDFTDNLYRYDAVANRADYTRNELEKLVASGDFTLVRQPVAKWKWELNHVTFYPWRAEEHGLEGISPWNGPRPDGLMDTFVYTPIETSIGIGLGQLLDNALSPQDAQEKLSGWIRDAVQRLEADHAGAR